MKILLFSILFLFLSRTGYTQNVEIPDTAFLHALIDLGVDASNDSVISYSEAEVCRSLKIDNRGGWGCGIDNKNGIKSLTGIEAFINLDTLLISCSQLKTLDISNNKELKVLSCMENDLVNLDVSNNLKLSELYCTDNLLTNLDLSNNVALVVLSCGYNQIKRLDLSGNVELYKLVCEYNDFTEIEVSNNINLNYLDLEGSKIRSLDISGNVNLKYIDIDFTSNLYEVCVWTLPFPPAEVDVLTTGSPNIYFTTECSVDTIVFIPDTAFFYALIRDGVDVNNDGLISNAEAEAVTELIVTTEQISDLTGIERFLNVQSLHCENNMITSLNLSNNTELIDLYCHNNALTSLDVSYNTKLSMLYCIDNDLTSITGLSNTSISELWCRGNMLTSLDVSNFPTLTGLDCANNQITSLNVTNDTALLWLHCNNNQLTSINVSTNTNLTLWGHLGHWHGPGLECSNNQLTSLDVSNNNKLVGLGCNGNQLTTLDISKNLYIKELWLGDMPSLDKVCVWWESSNPPDTVNYDTTGSPNVYFTTECSSTGIIENNSNLFVIYPNPVKDILYIETGNVINSVLEIYTINGVLLFKKELNSRTDGIDFLGYKNGIYIIKIFSDKTLYSRKIIVSR